MNTDTLPELCNEPGHVDGCPGRAGGDHEYRLRRRPVVSRTPALWVAEADGIAHARAHRISSRTACGIPAIDERYAWPTMERCPVCVAVLEQAAVA